MGFFNSMFGDGGMGAVANQMGGLATTGINNGNTLFTQGQNINGLLTPFAQRQMTSPTGLGATNLAQMQTQAGQSVAGGTGAGMRTAMDMGARTGNTAAVPGMIANFTKAGAKTQADNNLDLGIKNTMEKLSQQQQGSNMLNGIMDSDRSNANAGYQLGNDALKNELEARKMSQDASKAGFKSLMGGVSGAFDALSPMMGSSKGSDAMGGLGSFASLFA